MTNSISLQKCGDHTSLASLFLSVGTAQIVQFLLGFVQFLFSICAVKFLNNCKKIKLLDKLFL